MAQITIYTDGSALGNPGPGGYGAVLLSGHHRKELSQGFRLTTNNRMELMGVCVALETLKFEGSEVVIYSDSKYVVDAVEKRWVFGWEKKGFAGKKNPDLWTRFLRSYRRHNVRFIWVKGHADTVENNRCDQLAVAAANDRAQLQEAAHVNILERWGGGVDTNHVLLTTGTATRDAHTSATATGQRKSICKADVLKLMTAMDADNVPEAGRYMLLDAYMYADLLNDLSESDKWMFQNSANVQSGVLGNLYGFNIMKRSSVLRVTSAKALLKWGAEGAADENAAALAWQESCLSRALGEVKMFDDTDSPTYYGDIYSFLVRTGGGIRRYDKKGVFMLAEAATA